MGPGLRREDEGRFVRKSLILRKLRSSYLEDTLLLVKRNNVVPT